MKRNRLLTVDDLLLFCQEHGFAGFSSEQYGYTLAVQTPGNLVFDGTEQEDEDLLYAHLKVCHTLLNRNKSFISEENMAKAMPSLKYKPVLAAFIETDNGELDFNSHDMRIVENDEGEQEVEYIEQQVGNFTVDEPYMEYDSDMDKTYVHANAVIPRQYTKAAEIIERKKGTKVSCELNVKSFTYNAKEKWIEFTDFTFTGVTLLGEHIGEGMLGSRLDIADFSEEKNSVFYHGVKPMSTEAELLINNSMKGGSEVNKLTELLAQYGRTLEELSFASEVENMTDEELEERFAQEFAEESAEDSVSDGEADIPETMNEDDVESAEGSEAEDTEVDGAEGNDVQNDLEDESDSEDGSVNDEPDAEVSDSFSVNIAGTEYSFELSLNERVQALTQLVNATYGTEDNTFYSVEAYEDNLVMIDWWTDVAYRQSYADLGEGNFGLIGDRIRVYRQYLSQDEIDDLASLRQNYASLVAQQEQDARNAVLNDAGYEAIHATDEWNELVAHAANFSASDLALQADALFGRFCKKTPSMGKVSFSAETPKKKGPYGNLFDKD